MTTTRELPPAPSKLAGAAHARQVADHAADIARYAQEAYDAAAKAAREARWDDVAPPELQGLDRAERLAAERRDVTLDAWTCAELAAAEVILDEGSKTEARSVTTRERIARNAAEHRWGRRDKTSVAANVGQSDVPAPVSLPVPHPCGRAHVDGQRGTASVEA